MGIFPPTLPPRPYKKKLIRRKVAGIHALPIHPSKQPDLLTHLNTLSISTCLWSSSDKNSRREVESHEPWLQSPRDSLMNELVRKHTKKWETVFFATCGHKLQVTNSYDDFTFHAVIAEVFHDCQTQTLQKLRAFHFIILDDWRFLK